MAFNPRSYQIIAHDKVLADWEEGQRKTMIVAGTGAGKTIIFWYIAQTLLQQKPDARIMVMAHRQDLIDQAYARLIEFWPNEAFRSGRVMNVHNDWDRQIIIASVQTLNKEGRLEQVLSAGAFDLIITDECHNALSDGYANVYAANEELNPEWRHLGVTATPRRADSRGLIQLYKKVSETLDTPRLVRLGALAKPKWLAIQTGISIREINSAGRGADKDLVAEELASVYETDNCFDLVVESHKKFAEGRHAIAFCASVDGAYALAEKFNAAGYKAVAASHKTSKAERKRIVAAVRAGQYDVVVNMGIYTEGFDAPILDCVHMVRPTMNDSLYLQCVGRGLRTYPGKEDALILDYAPVEARQIAMAGDVLGITKKIRKDAILKDSEERGEVIGGFVFDGENAEWLTGDPAHLIAKQLDYMEGTYYHWTGPKGGWLTIGLGEGSDGRQRTLAISPPGEIMQLWGVISEKGTQRKAYEVIKGNFDEVLAKSDQLCEKWGNPSLARKEKAWRRQDSSSSPKLVEFGKNLKVWHEGITKGDLADAITRKLALITLKKAGLDVGLDLQDMKMQKKPVDVEPKKKRKVAPKPEAPEAYRQFAINLDL